MGREGWGAFGRWLSLLSSWFWGFLFFFALRVIFDADTTALNAYTNEFCLRLDYFLAILIYYTY